MDQVERAKKLWTSSVPSERAPQEELLRDVQCLGEARSEDRLQEQGGRCWLQYRRYQCPLAYPTIEGRDRNSA